MPYLCPQQAGIPDLEVIILNWNGRKLLEGCLEMLFRDVPDHGVLITVVDNHSSDGSQEMLRHRFGGKIQIISSVENRGFAGGNNLALGPCQARHALLLNSDTVLGRDHPHPWDQLLCYMDAHPDVGVVGPRLVRSNGEIEDSTGDAICFTNILKNSLFRILRLPRAWTDRFSRTLWTYDRERDVDWVSGAALLVRGEIIREGCLLDETYFMYTEDVEWCYRIQSLGWKIRFFPGVTIRHLKYGSAPQSRTEKKRLVLHRTGLLHFTELHPSPRHFLLRGILKLCLLGNRSETR